MAARRAQGSGMGLRVDGQRERENGRGIKAARFGLVANGGRSGLWEAREGWEKRSDTAKRGKENEGDGTARTTRLFPFSFLSLSLAVLIFKLNDSSFVPFVYSNRRKSTRGAQVSESSWV